MMNKLKAKIDRAFNAASEKYDPATHDLIPLSAITLFVGELGKEFLGLNKGAK
jgi:hypothetical protein